MDTPMADTTISSAIVISAPIAWPDQHDHGVSTAMISSRSTKSARRCLPVKDSTPGSTNESGQPFLAARAWVTSDWPRPDIST